jgi:hypothetical protein
MRDLYFFGSDSSVFGCLSDLFLSSAFHGIRLLMSHRWSRVVTALIQRHSHKCLWSMFLEGFIQKIWTTQVQTKQQNRPRVSPSPEEILELLLGEFELKLLKKTQLKFECDCNRERLERVVLGLGREDLEDIIQTDGKAELVCHYCNSKHFNREQLEGLLAHA